MLGVLRAQQVGDGVDDSPGVVRRLAGDHHQPGVRYQRGQLPRGLFGLLVHLLVLHHESRLRHQRQQIRYVIASGLVEDELGALG